MRTLNAIVTAVVLTAIITGNQSALAFEQEKILAATHAIVMIRGYNETGGLAYGSGVVVANNKVLTNCHIFRTTKQPWVARGEDTYNISAVQADRWHDLCLLTMQDLPFKAVVIGKSSLLKRGENVLSIGHSYGVPTPLASGGSIKSTYLFDGEKVIRSSAQFRMGASGSGIFDEDGKLLGINTFKTPGKPAYFYSLPIEWLASLQTLPLETTFPITGKAFWEEDDDKKPFFMQIAIPEIKKDWLKLAQVAQKWIETDPTNSDAWYELGIAKENLYEIDEAKNAYKQSVALDATNTDSLFRLGLIAKSEGDQVTMQESHLAIAKVSADLAQEYHQLLSCKAEC